ncbi:MAG: GntR family transcriptional regulator, partial [Huintestinicola sp.]
MLKININYTSDKPMYEQIEDCIRQAVLTGQLENNTLLPSVRQLAADINVSTITIKRAYADLEREGVIYTVSGKGTYVRLDNVGKLQDKQTTEPLEKLEKNVTELKQAGVNKDTVVELVNKIYDRKTTKTEQEE